VVFLHWSRHPGRSFAGLSPEVADAFQSLARRAREKRLWVTTTGRLLAYAEARNAVRITAAPAGGNTEVRLTAAPLPDGRTLTAADLAGLSFAVPDPARTRIVYSGEALPVQPVPGEPGAVWVPWIPLGFPEPPEAA
jgi:hypothetical protein